MQESDDDGTVVVFSVVGTVQYDAPTQGDQVHVLSLSRHRGFASRGIVNPVPRTRGLNPLGTCEGVIQYIDGHVSGIICHDGQIHCTISSESQRELCNRTDDCIYELCYSNLLLPTSSILSG
ncbi:hypothetical protein AFLA_001493 [Aspergillus flavus NRRL3357]|nr:hypothetical protein AFLA_001493 [Aspergillus flavus NRRL3357]